LARKERLAKDNSLKKSIQSQLKNKFGESAEARVKRMTDERKAHARTEEANNKAALKERIANA
jgi:hypothetical protein